jgi:hypothetical protein
MSMDTHMSHGTAPYTTVGQVRARLLTLGITASKDDVLCLSSLAANPSKVQEALSTASKNPKAHAYLMGALDRLRLPPPNLPTRSDGPANATATQPLRLIPARQRLPNSRLTMVRHGDGITSLPPILAPIAFNSATESIEAREYGPSSAAQQVAPPTIERDSFHVYGGKAAIEFSPGTNVRGKAVVFIDAAVATGPRSYDWATKIRTMLTPDEMLIALAVMLNDAPAAKFMNHGEAKDKWIEIIHQGATVFFKVGQAKSVRAIPIGPTEVFKLAALLTAQVRKNAPEGARMDVADLVGATLGKMLTAAASQRTKSGSL